MRRDVLSSALAVSLFIVRGDGGIGAAEPARTITNEFGTHDVPTDPGRLILMGNRSELEIARALG